MDKDAIDMIIEHANERSKTRPYSWNAVRSACDCLDGTRLEYLRQQELYAKYLKEDLYVADGGTGNTTVNVGVTVEKVQKKRKLKKKKKKTPLVICVPLAKVVYLLNRNKKKKKRKKKKKKKKKGTGKKNARTKVDPREVAKLEMERLLKLCDEQQLKLLYMMNRFNVPEDKKVTVTRTADISCMQKFRDWMGITLVPVLGSSTDQTLETVIKDKAEKLGFEIVTLDRKGKQDVSSSS